ncbi:hypothetical protein E8D34_00115 [Nocardioides sp. GY 10113]|uniref:hypothetical protein n=1 Tax=Nocardioides sp. GY 10113 TaxID=2569761 RepID=UPI0010A82838|nr:hypothetical protein [Nocardioides sp. GY 10113]TIC88975.1 hypothetical protein E8D34_00115 [Nocardioides sp. GY 10113]
MSHVPPPARALARRALAAVVALAAALATLVIGLASPASAAGERMWTLTDVTFDDGGTMTGILMIDSTGTLVDFDVVTSGGDTAIFGTSTTYDLGNSEVIAYPGMLAIHLDYSRYFWITPSTSLVDAAPDAVVPIEIGDSSYECNNCTDVRYITSGSLQETSAITLSGTPAISGTTTVGQTLSVNAASLTTTPASATKTYQWLRDGNPIASATGTTYQPVNADAGHTISVRVGATLYGYPDATTKTSTGVGPVDGGTITLPNPTITGTPKVGVPLTASVTGLDPADAAVAYSWVGGSPTASTGGTYTPTAADLGAPLRVDASATRSYFDTASSSTTTAAVLPGTFSTGPTASISGTFKVGETLTAGTGTTVPAADSFGYQWYADGSPISGADQATYTLTAAELHQAISVRVTAHLAGYADAVDTTTPAGDVATNLAPDLELSVAKSTLRRGQSTTLTWSSAEATSLTARGRWTGDRATSGTESVTPTAVGVNTYVLTARNENGVTRAQVTVDLRREAEALTVRAGKGLRLAGDRITIRARGLDPREAFTVTVGDTTVATGNAGRHGKVQRTVTVPSGLGTGKARVVLTGAESDRRGVTTVRVFTVKELRLRLADDRVRASDEQTVTVTGLVPGERVAVTYQDERISPQGARADARGRYTASFGVDIWWGTKTVRAVGLRSGATASGSFDVVRRCQVGRVCP